MIVYKATNKLNNKIYIGKTVKSLKERNRLRKYDNNSFDLLYQELGEEGFNWEIIDTATNEKCLNKKESYWIKYYNSTDPEIGYNMMGGNSNAWKTNIVKEHIREALSGDKNHMYNKKYEDNPTSKPIIDINTGKIYVSLTKASEELFDGEPSITRISASCRGVKKSYKGYKFRFYNILEDTYIKTKFDEGYNINTDPLIKEKLNREYGINILTGEKLHISELSKKYGISEKNMKDRIYNNGNKLDRDYKFKSLEDIWIREDKYEIYKNNIKDFIYKPGNKIKNLFDNLEFSSLEETVKYYKNLGYRISKDTVRNNLKTGKPMKFLKDFKFIYADN